MILNVPLAVHLIYASAAGLVFPLTRHIIELREKEEIREKLDHKASNLSIIAGVLFVIFGGQIGVGKSVGATLIMFGLYLMVKDPAVLYVGAIILVADFVIEYAMILNNELSYAASYGDVGTSFFLIGAIISSIYLMTKKNSHPLKSSESE